MKDAPGTGKGTGTGSEAAGTPRDPGPAGERGREVTAVNPGEGKDACPVRFADILRLLGSGGG